jgi:hypothetical protein
LEISARYQVFDDLDVGTPASLLWPGLKLRAMI